MTGFYPRNIVELPSLSIPPLNGVDTIMPPARPTRRGGKLRKTKNRKRNNKRRRGTRKYL